MRDAHAGAGDGGGAPEQEEAAEREAGGGLERVARLGRALEPVAVLRARLQGVQP